MRRVAEIEAFRLNPVHFAHADLADTLVPQPQRLVDLGDHDDPLRAAASATAAVVNARKTSTITTVP